MKHGQLPLVSLSRVLTCAALLFSAASTSCAGAGAEHADCPKVNAPSSKDPKGMMNPTLDVKELQIAGPDAAKTARPACAGFIEVKRGNTTKVLTSSCAAWRPLEGPYGEILDPAGKTRVIVEGCDEETFVDVVGSAKVLPGNATDVRVRWTIRDGGQEWVSAHADLTVTDFGAVGGLLRGRFHAIMTPKLNAPAEQISGTFGVCRGADRSPP